MLEVLSEVLVGTGLILDIVGVCLLAYDALHGAGRHFWLGNFDGYLKDAARQRDIELATWKRMEAKGASKEYVSQLTKESEERYKASEEEIQSRIHDLRDGYPSRVANLAYRGLLLTALGFLLQLFGTIIS